MKRYRATYRYEVEFVAVDDEDAKAQWMDIDLDNLAFELLSAESAVVKTNFPSDSDVEIVCIGNAK